MNRLFLLLVLFISPCLLLAGEDPSCSCSQCQSGECSVCRCAHCGCQTHCQKICHVVCEWKDVKEYVYACHCTDICIPGRSEKCCTKIDECNPDNCPCLHDYKPLYSIWNPSDCAGIRPVTKLVKIQVTHKVPTYKWVVEYCCAKCCADITQQEAHEKALAENTQPGAQPVPQTEPRPAAPIDNKQLATDHVESSTKPQGQVSAYSVIQASTTTPTGAATQSATPIQTSAPISATAPVQASAAETPANPASKAMKAFFGQTPPQQTQVDQNSSRRLQAETLNPQAVLPGLQMYPPGYQPGVDIKVHD